MKLGVAYHYTISIKLLTLATMVFIEIIVKTAQLEKVMELEKKLHWLFHRF